MCVEIADGLEGMGRVAHRAIERGFDFQLRAAPWMYSITYWLLMRFAPVRWFAQRLLYTFGARPLTRMITKRQPDVVISTYPATTVVLGRLRMRRVIPGPVYAAITDLTGLFFWAHPGIDMHFAVYAESAETVERIAGPDSVAHVAPLVDEAFFSPCTRSDARERLDLPPAGRVVLVSGGGWGVGDLEGATRAALDFDDVTVVVVAGRNERVKDELAHAFAGDARVRVLGFTDQMRDLLVAADVLVHSTGGVTVIEAALCGCPSISYGLSVGHVLHNTRAMAEIGVTGLAESPQELARELARHLGGVPVDPACWDMAADVAELVFSRPSRVKPLPVWRMATTKAAANALIAVVAVGWMLTSDDTFALASHVLPIRPLGSGAARDARNARGTGLTIDAPEAAIPRIAAELERDGVRASFGVGARFSRATGAAVTRTGNELMLNGSPTGRISWLRTRSALARYRRASHTTGRVYYEAPPKGLTMGEYLLATTMHGRAVRPAAELVLGRALTGPPPRTGSVVEVSMTSASPIELNRLDQLLSGLRGEGVTLVPVSAIDSSGPTRAAIAVDEDKTTAPAATTASAAITSAPPSGVPRRFSPASTIASVTGTTISITNITGATRVAGTRCSADISLSRPIPPPIAVAAVHSTQTTHA